MTTLLLLFEANVSLVGLHFTVMTFPKVGFVVRAFVHAFWPRLELSVVVVASGWWWWWRKSQRSRAGVEYGWLPPFFKCHEPFFSLAARLLPWWRVFCSANFLVSASLAAAASAPLPT